MKHELGKVVCCWKAKCKSCAFIDDVNDDSFQQACIEFARRGWHQSLEGDWQCPKCRSKVAAHKLEKRRSPEISPEGQKMLDRLSPLRRQVSKRK